MGEASPMLPSAVIPILADLPVREAFYCTPLLFFGPFDINP